MHPNHSTVHEQLGSYQHCMLPVILAAAQAAKDKCKQFQDIAHSMFFASKPSGTSVHASQAEETLQKYKDGVPIKLNCWGCGEDHLWMTKGKITCPRSKDPQVIKNAETSFANFKAALRWGGSSKPKSNGGKKTGKSTIKFEDLDKCSQKKMRETVLAMSADIGSTASTIPSSVTSVSSGLLGAGSKVFMLLVAVFNITPPSSQVLPVSTLSHILCCSWGQLSAVPIVLLFAALLILPPHS
jgi:hypothetical protein